MDNFHDFISEHPPVKRLRVNDLLLAEYQCPLKDNRFEIWSHHNYFIYVTSGEKKWFNLNQEMHLKPGDCLFVCKGSYRQLIINKTPHTSINYREYREN